MKLLVLLLFLSVFCWDSVPHAQDARQFYLVPRDGAGTDADPFRARCQNLAGKGVHDLTPYGIPRFLCASDSLPANMTGVVQLGASLSTNITAIKPALNVLLGRTIAANTVHDLIVELISERLRAGRDGKFKIYLGGSVPLYEQTAWVPFRDGGLVADVVNAVEPAMAWAATLALETFNCADSGALSCIHTWIEVIGTAWGITSNQATASGSTTAVARNDSSLDTTDHDVSAALVSLTTGGGGTNSTCGPIARKENNVTDTFYRAVGVVRNTGELSETQLTKNVTGTVTVLDGDVTDLTAGEVLTISVSGSTIIGKRNGVTTMQVTDTSITTGTYGGLRYFSDSASGACTVDEHSSRDGSSFGPFRRRTK